MEPIDGLLAEDRSMASFAVFSVEGVLAPTAPIACSNGFPWLFGVLAEPKDANAPDPRPNWLAPPALVGDVRPPPGVVALKGLAARLPWEDEGPPPLRRARLEKSRGVVVELSEDELLGVDSERLLRL